MIEIPRLGFEKSIDRLTGEAKRRIELSTQRILTGVTFLDRVFKSLLPRELMMIGGEPGAGKTQLLTSIAVNYASQGKRVHFFALEADPDEIESRISYQYLSKKYEKIENYRDYVLGEYNLMIGEDKPNIPPTLFTYYRDSEFDLRTFERVFAAIAGSTDMVIIDHIHYFDLESENENKEITSIVKSIRTLGIKAGVPIIFAAHLRKLDRKSKLLVPDMEDFMGSSNLQKIATKIVTISSGGPSGPNTFITYMKVPKFRLFGSARSFIGKTTFNDRTNSYESGYKVGKEILDGNTYRFIEYADCDLPKWLRSSG